VPESWRLREGLIQIADRATLADRSRGLPG